MSLYKMLGIVLAIGLAIYFIDPVKMYVHFMSISQVDPQRAALDETIAEIDRALASKECGSLFKDALASPQPLAVPADIYAFPITVPELSIGVGSEAKVLAQVGRMLPSEVLVEKLLLINPIPGAPVTGECSPNGQCVQTTVTFLLGTMFTKDRHPTIERRTRWTVTLLTNQDNGRIRGCTGKRATVNSES